MGDNPFWQICLHGPQCQFGQRSEFSWRNSFFFFFCIQTKKTSMSLSPMCFRFELKKTYIYEAELRELACRTNNWKASHITTKRQIKMHAYDYVLIHTHTCTQSQLNRIKISTLCVGLLKFLIKIKSGPKADWRWKRTSCLTLSSSMVVHDIETPGTKVLGSVRYRVSSRTKREQTLS